MLTQEYELYICYICQRQVSWPTPGIYTKSTICGPHYTDENGTFMVQMTRMVPEGEKRC